MLLLAGSSVASAADISVGLSTGAVYTADTGLRALGGTSADLVNQGQLRVAVGVSNTLSVVGEVGANSVHSRWLDATSTPVARLALDEQELGLGVRLDAKRGGAPRVVPYAMATALLVHGSLRLDDDGTTTHNVNQLRWSGFAPGGEGVLGCELRFNPERGKLHAAWSFEGGGRLRGAIAYGDAGKIGGSGGVARSSLSVSF